MRRDFMKKKVLCLYLAITLLIGLASGVNVFFGAEVRNVTERIEAESFDENSGGNLKIETNGKDLENIPLTNIGGTSKDAWLKYNNVDFSAANVNKASVRIVVKNDNCAPNGAIEIRMDSLEGDIIGTIPLRHTGSSWNAYATFTTDLDAAVTGTHDLFFVLRDTTDSGKSYIGNIDYFEFSYGAEPEPTHKDAYSNIEFEDYDSWSGGGMKIETSDDNTAGKKITNIGGTANNNWIQFNIDFAGNGADKFNIRYALKDTASTTSTLEVRLSKVDGELLGTISLPQTSGNWNDYTTVTAELDIPIVGEQEIFIVYRGDAGKAVANIDYMTFSEASEPVKPIRKVSERIEAESFDNNSGGNLKIETSGKDLNDVPLTNIGGTYKDAWLMFSNINFDETDVNKASVRLVSKNDNCAPAGAIELRLDSLDGDIIGTIPLRHTGSSWNAYSVFINDLDVPVTGLHDLFFIMRDTTNSGRSYIGNIDYLEFSYGENPEPEYKNAYSNIEFEDYDSWSVGGMKIETSNDNTAGKRITNIGGTGNNNWIQFNVDFAGNGADKFSVRYVLNTSHSANSKLELRLGATDGELIGTISLPQTSGNWNDYTTVSADLVKQIDGNQDVFVLLLGDEGKAVANLDYFVFEEAENPIGEEPDPTPTEDPEPTPTPTEGAPDEPNSINGIYQISNVDELLWVAENPDKNYMLTKDIDLSQRKDWEPIGSEAKPFSGVFNGMGHTITIDIDKTKTDEEISLVGLFGYVTGTINQLTVNGTIDTSIYSGYVGGIAANIAGGKIIDCVGNVNLNVIGTASYINIGGIVGAIRSGYGAGTIQNCTNNGTIDVKMPNLSNTGSGDVGNGTRSTTGGIVGLICVGTTGNITACINNGDITVDNGQPNVGGIAGQTSSNNDASIANILYCANKGDITVTNIKGERAGGIIAYVKSATINYSYNIGEIKAFTDNGTTVARSGYGNTFGILGYANLGPNNKLEMKYCYSATQTPLEAEICTVRNPQHGTFQNFYMNGREEYETTLNGNATAGTAGTSFTNAADLYSKITSTEEGAKAYTSNNVEGGYPMLYFEKPVSLEVQDFNSNITAVNLGNSIHNINYLLQIGPNISKNDLVVTATLSSGSTVVMSEILSSVESAKIGETTYVPANNSNLYAVTFNNVGNNIWETATITVKTGSDTLYTKVLNSNEVITGSKIPFNNFLTYPEGEVGDIYNSGPGLANDKQAVTDEDSKMVVISSTNETVFEQYIQDLLAAGFEQINKNQIEENIFYTLKNEDQYYYIYYTAHSKQVRIIQDNSSRNLLTDLDAKAIGNGKTEFYLYSLDYTQAEGQTTKTDYWKIDCGAMMIIKLADNSLFIIDSGHDRQTSEAAKEGLMKFMYDVTGQEEGTIINIRAWFFSHAHGDHVYMAHEFIDDYHENINLESVLHNFPSFHTVGGGYDAGTFLMKDSVNGFFPNTKYVKLHTGQNFSLQGVNIEVLHTHEDAVSPSGTPGITNFNNTSVILKLTLDGKSIMMLGDASNALQDSLLKLYSVQTLKSDAVQVAHHNYDDLATLYAKIGAPLALIPNSEVNAGPNSGNANKYKGIINAAENVTVLYADPDTQKITVENGKFKHEAISSYRAGFKTVTLPNLDKSLLSDAKGTKIDLVAALKKQSLMNELIDKSVIGTPAINTSEVAYLIFDGDTATKFCTNTVPATIGWTMKKPVKVDSYVIYSANDNATRKGRNPQKWILCGSNDGENWTVLDSVNTPNLPDTNFTGTAFDVANPGSYQYYVLKVFETAGDSVLQFSELELYSGTTNITDVVKPVIDAIDNLPAIEDLKLSDEPLVNAVIDDYNALTDAQKALVTNYSKLVDLQAKLADLKEEAAIQVVIDAINAIPAVNEIKISDENLVVKARGLYDALTDSQKEKVTNYTDLKAAESKIEELKTPTTNPPGENPKTGEADIALMLVISMACLLGVFAMKTNKGRKKDK